MSNLLVYYTNKYIKLLDKNINLNHQYYHLVYLSLQ